MKFLFASDSFKGSLSGRQTAELLTKAAGEVFPQAECVSILIADGGEGTCAAVTEARCGKLISKTVHGPLMDLTEAAYGRLSDREAVIEMAAASGLSLIPEEKRSPLRATSFGTGELIRDALEKGFSDITIGIGGSATNDGGMGCMRALGVRFFDENGTELAGTGADLIRVCRIDRSALEDLSAGASFHVMCDVDNPLCGPDGATHTYGPQKGASEEDLRLLEEGMCHYRDVLLAETGVDPDRIAGGGAAGGLGAALAVFLGAEMRSGIETLLDLVRFDELAEGADLIVTGEGRTDGQSAHGKVLSGIGKRAGKKGIPVIALSGSLGPGYEKLYESGIASFMTAVDAPMSLQQAMADAESLYYQAAVRMFRMLEAGRKMGK